MIQPENFQKTEINPLQSEHLTNGEKPIIACVGSAEDFEGEFNKNVDDPENVNWFAVEEELQEKKLLNAGEGTYVISLLDNKNKRSDGYGPCTGVVVVGRDKNTKENISFLTHQFFTRLSMFGLDSRFGSNLMERLADTKDQCVHGSIDAVVFGGISNDGMDNRGYEKAIDALTTIVHDRLGFSPVIITGPKIYEDKDQEDNVLFDTKNRRLYIERPKVGDTSTESYLLKDIEKQEEKWKAS